MLDGQEINEAFGKEDVLSIEVEKQITIQYIGVRLSRAVRKDLLKTIRLLYYLFGI